MANNSGMHDLEVTLVANLGDEYEVEGNNNYPNAFEVVVPHPTCVGRFRRDFVRVFLVDDTYRVVHIGDDEVIKGEATLAGSMRDLLPDLVRETMAQHSSRKN